MAVVLVFIEVVSTHEPPSASLGDGSLEGRQIDLVQGTLADHDVHLMAVFFVVVQRIVLHTGRHTLRLQPLNVRHHHARCQPRVFTHIFEVAASKRCAVDIYAWPKNHRLAAIEGLFA